MLRNLGIGMVALCMTAGLSMTGCGDDDSGAVCGDGVVEGSEVCDDANLNGQTCSDEGFTGGALACNADCGGFDTSGCNDDVCGDDTVTGMEDCDGANLDGTACTDLGYDGGTLSCTGTCAFDETACTLNCGDDTMQAGDEVCDGADLGGADCASEGFDAGTLACNVDCQGLDTSSCCDDACPAEDDTRCTGDTLGTCTLGANGCLDWVDTDCTASGDICNGTPADCNPPCTSDCPALGGTRCVDADNLETCTDGGDGCTYWTASTCGANSFCWGDPAMCNSGYPGEDCSEPIPLAAGVNTITPGTYDASTLDVLDATMVDCYNWSGDTDAVFTFTMGAADNAADITITKGVDNRLVAVILDDCLAPTDGTALACGTEYSNPTFTLSGLGLTPGATYHLVVGNAYPSASFPDPDLSQIEVVTYNHSCGDGAVHFAEECDDGNTATGDGCDATCAVETGFWCGGGDPSTCGAAYTNATATYGWVDISTTGATVLLGDDTAELIPLGFSFPFYGDTYADVYINSNGALSFGASNTTWNTDCPLTPANANMIAVMWDDLDPADTNDPAYYQYFASCPSGGTQACAVITYQNYKHYNGTAGEVAGTFQAILFADGSILLQYQDVGTESGLNAAVGTVGGVGDAAATNYGTCGTADLTANDAYCFSPPSVTGCL